MQCVSLINKKKTDQTLAFPNYFNLDSEYLLRIRSFCHNDEDKKYRRNLLAEEDIEIDEPRRTAKSSSPMKFKKSKVCGKGIL